jgi:hypothetical protein
MTAGQNSGFSATLAAINSVLKYFAVTDLQNFILIEDIPLCSNTHSEINSSFRQE